MSLFYTKKKKNIGNTYGIEKVAENFYKFDIMLKIKRKFITFVMITL